MSATINTLKKLCELINISTGSPATPYTRTETGLVANIGNFHLSQGYGGVCVHRIANEDGGITTPIWATYISKKAAEGNMRAYLAGCETRKAEGNA
jgi:hypothetical protein